LYSLLHLTGYDLPMEQLKQFRQWGSSTPGHPERGTTPGVETTTGPLGQGFANAVGMAIAEAHLAQRYNQPDYAMADHYTWCLVSDGDLMEGLCAEAASLAGHLQLGKLICLYDQNHVTLSASIDMSFTEDCQARFEAYGWHTQTVTDGNNLLAIENALLRAKEETLRPSLILVRTHIGFGSPHKQDSFGAHGSPLGAEEVACTKINLNWPTEPAFFIPEAAATHFKRALIAGALAEAAWNETCAAYEIAFPLQGQALLDLISGRLPTGWDDNLPQFPADATGLSTRSAGAKIMNVLAQRLPGLFGGSADLDPSTCTGLTDLGDFQSPQITLADRQGSSGGGWSFAGRNLHFGIREHAMGAILNGLAAHGGVLPFCATFLVFADYMRAPIRLAALMGLHVVYVFTHDSIAVGEDGATHQPIEQLASLRAIPGLTVIRPCDANETVAAWRVAMTSLKQPVALILTRQPVPTLDRSGCAASDGVAQGAYILADAGHGEPDLILIASGSEVALIVAAREELMKLGLKIRLVSMPSWELFEAQSAGYRDQVLPPAITARLAVEAGVAQGWHKYTGDKGAIIAIDSFGASAPGATMLKKYGYTVDNVCARALTIL
jgi:transketolase